MSRETESALPPNPFKRSPIRNLDHLAGRTQEQKTIRYYLNLTASGGNPHLALIGQRGVGKTSLLNSAESMARELELLPVRLDMNELKAQSPGRFWHDLYQTLALSMVKVGCWGGEQGRIYADLLRMINSRQPGEIESAVIQIPYLFSCHQGDIDSFECPDSLVVNDFNICLTELKKKEMKGIVLLIDEADCLGKNIALLQMFRNIFQAIEGCSLTLAGTEAVFPSLSEVFSPIPRQFHRIDVKSFAQEFDTAELVHRAIKDADNRIRPDFGVIRELHTLCGGAPDEIQLYCHHMYRSVEDGTTKSMVFAPQVFREVLGEYRANTPANIEAVLNAIERLPDKLLFESRWVSRRNLTLEENIKISVLYRELKRGIALSTEERAEIAEELTEGYRMLFNSGITTVDTRIQLVGTPLTAGFWKSFVEVERSKRWSWNDDSFKENLQHPIINAVREVCGSNVAVTPRVGNNMIEKLTALRAGEEALVSDDSLGDLIITWALGNERNATHAVDVEFQMDSTAGKTLFALRVIEGSEKTVQRELIDEWLETYHTLLASNQITLVLTEFVRWALPTKEEVRRLNQDIGGQMLDAFLGPSEMSQAVSKFEGGDIQGCMDMFEKMLEKEEDPRARNNLGFCQILTGNIPDGLKNATTAATSNGEPLFILNKGIAQFLSGKESTGKETLREALSQVRSSSEPNEAMFVLVLHSLRVEVQSHKGIPLDVAILLNLFRMGDLEYTELERELKEINPARTLEWLEILNTS